VDGTYLDAVIQAPPTPIGTGAKRQVTFLEQWKHCEGIFRTKSLDPQIEECMRVAGRLLEDGIRWQEPRWQSRRSQQGVVLSAFEELRKHLGTAPARDFEDIAREVNDVRRQASRLVALEKGQFSLVSQGGVSYGA
jgi:hypothetical protein